MTPLTWTELARLAIMLGFNAADRIKRNAENNNEKVTTEEWDALREDVNISSSEALGPRPS